MFDPSKTLVFHDFPWFFPCFFHGDPGTFRISPQGLGHHRSFQFSAHDLVEPRAFRWEDLGPPRLGDFYGMIYDDLGLFHNLFAAI